MSQINEIFSRTSLCEGLVIPKKMSLYITPNNSEWRSSVEEFVTAILRSGVRELYLDENTYNVSVKGYNRNIPNQINPLSSVFNGKSSKLNTELQISHYKIERGFTRRIDNFFRSKPFLSTTSDFYITVLSPDSVSPSGIFKIFASKEPLTEELISTELEEYRDIFLDNTNTHDRGQPTGFLGLLSAALMVAFSADIRSKIDENPESILKLTNKDFFNEIKEFRPIY